MIKLNFFWIDLLREIVELYGYQKNYFNNGQEIIKEYSKIFELQNDYYITLDDFNHFIWTYIDYEKMKKIMEYCDMKYDENIEIPEYKNTYDRIHYSNKEKVLFVNKEVWYENICNINIIEKSIFYDYIGEIDTTVNLNNDVFVLSIYHTSIFDNTNNIKPYRFVRVYMKKNKQSICFKNAMAYEEG